MDEALLQMLPVAHRLALYYAPQRAWEPTLGLLALDARLAAIIRTDGEPVIAQMKLAWWRERLAEEPQDWPKGEPLLALLADTGLERTLVGKLVDGWEMVLAERLGERELLEFADGRAAGWEAVGMALDCSEAKERTSLLARSWALNDLSLHLGTEGEAQFARQVAQRHAAAGVRVPRELRTLAVLHALTTRAMRRGSDEVLDGPVAMLTALRVGIVGR